MLEVISKDTTSTKYKIFYKRRLFEVYYVSNWKTNLFCFGYRKISFGLLFPLLTAGESISSFNKNHLIISTLEKYLLQVGTLDIDAALFLPARKIYFWEGFVLESRDLLILIHEWALVILSGIDINSSIITLSSSMHIL